jgi:hypothetical protein
MMVGVEHDPALEAKLDSIEQGEARGLRTLVLICESRTTPDVHRARALRILADRVDGETLGPILRSVGRSCGPLTAGEIFWHAASYPMPLKLELGALSILERSTNHELRVAALGALEVIGTPRSYSMLDQIGAHGIKAIIAARHPNADALRGTLALADTDGGDLSIVDS